jgi:hypothetical protein
MSDLLLAQMGEVVARRPASGQRTSENCASARLVNKEIACRFIPDSSQSAMVELRAAQEES